MNLHLFPGNGRRSSLSGVSDDKRKHRMKKKNKKNGEGSVIISIMFCWQTLGLIINIGIYYPPPMVDMAQGRV